MISIIIVSTNTKKLIRECIKSIVESGGECEIVVVDNASTDGTIEALEEYSRKFLPSRQAGANAARKPKKDTAPLPTLKLIKNQTNLGYTKSNNIGAKNATCSHLVFLNPDTTILSKNFIDKINKFLESNKIKKALKINNKKLGIVGFKFTNPDGSLQPSAGNFPTLLRIVLHRIPFFRKRLGVQIRDNSFYKKPGLVDWVSGSGLLVEKEAYKKIGGMDENIFMYGEDYDLCFRLEKEGYKNYLYPSVRIMHYDTGKNNPLKKPYKYYAMRKGFAAFLKKHRSALSFNMFLLLVKLEAVMFLGLLPFRNYNKLRTMSPRFSRSLNKSIKSLWKKHLLMSTHITS
ncbi:MAG: glycosyltransferase family 2 protein [Patescibacteria group bacterium]